MLLALDYDETYTRDKEFWNQVIELAKSRGHAVIVATMRYEHEGKDVKTDLADKVEKIIFTGRKAKYRFVTLAGYMPSVWIDDNPYFILMDAKA